MNINLKNNEIIIREMHPDSSLLLLWIFTKCLAVTLFSFWIIFFFIFFSVSMSGGVMGMESFMKFSDDLALFVIIAFGIVIMYHHYLRKTYVYYITNHRCVFQGGIIKRIRRSVSYDKITDVEISQNILERFLGIGRINVHTASMGTQKSEISFVGLKDAEAPLTDINSNMESGGDGGN